MKDTSFQAVIQKNALQKDVGLIKKQLNDTENILKIANLLLKNNFLFTRTWDMEPCHTPYEINPINWLANPNEDDEWTFMLNRFNYIEYLALGTILTEDSKYLEHAKALIFDWINNHCEIISDYSTRTLDTGMRIDAWVDLLIYLEKFNLLSAEDIQQIEENIIKQIIYMRDEYIPKYTLSNWGSIQTAVIIRVLPMLTDFERKEEIYQWALEEFETQIKLQVYDDGLHWEQSTMYHAEVLHYSLKLVNLESYSMPTDIKNIIYQMSEALLYQMTPTRAFEAFGDSDISNLISLLNLAAVTFKEEKFKVNDESINNMDNLYEMTVDEINIYNELTSNLPKELNFDGFDSGMFTSRNNWGIDANFTLFTNGTMGSGHAHADNNHLSIYHEGKGIVVDSGRYTYREEDQRRVELKSAQAHSSVIIDGLASSIPNGSWTFERYLKPIANRVKHKKEFHYFQGTVLSSIEPHFYVHTRKVMSHNLGIWFVLDDVRSQGQHSLQTFFNIEPNVQIDSVADGLLLNNLKFVSLDEELKINNQIYSPTYNQLKNNIQIELNSSFIDQSITTKIFMNRKYKYEQVKILRDKKEAIADDLGIAIKITMTPAHTVTFVVIHEELYDGRKNLYCEGMPFHAKAVAIEEKNGEKNIYVLST